MRPLFSYYGGKYRAAPRYPKPEHDTIIEPFAGSAGYACRFPDRKVILVEKDPIVAAVWRFLINAPASEIRGLRDVPVAGTVDDIGLHACQEAKWLVGFWLNKGSAQPKRRPSSFMRSGVRPNCVWGEVVRERIASSLVFIRHWQIVEGEYSQAPDIEATWFIDPPYQRRGKYYRESEVNFLALSRWVKSRRGLVIACEQDGADWLPFSPLASTKARKGHSAEIVYVARRNSITGCNWCRGPLNGNESYCSDECCVADARRTPTRAGSGR